MTHDIFRTKWGWVGVAATERGVRAIVLPKPTRRAAERGLRGASSDGAGRDAARHLKAAKDAITKYLEGRVREFDVPLDLDGQPRFCLKVWETLRRIPYGRVRSYGWVARRIGKPRAARAVGAACGANPVPLLVPCHRVVAGDGSLGGFSGGLPNKKRLLKLEGAWLE